MGTSALTRFAVTISVAVALLTACNGSSPIGAPGLPYPSTDSIAMTVPHFVAGPKRPDHGKSWMSPAAKLAKKLLYVSDWSTNDVFVYNYNDGTLTGQLTGFNDPYGQCVDKKGDVWIVNFGAGSVVEYAHGGTIPLKTLSTVEDPLGCSVDPTTGNLAVAGSNEVDIFAHARGRKQVYQNHLCFPFWAPGYDKAGNLYVEALLYGSVKPLGQYSDPLACELPHGGTSLRGVHFSGFGIYYPGSIMWDGKYLTLTDQDYLDRHKTAIYRVTEDASGNLTLAGQTILTDTCDRNDVEVPQPFIDGKTVVGGNLRCSPYGSRPKFDYWAYPAGGNPKSSLQSPPAKPVGQSVSIAP